MQVNRLKALAPDGFATAVERRLGNTGTPSNRPKRATGLAPGEQAHQLLPRILVGGQWYPCGIKFDYVSSLFIPERRIDVPLHAFFGSLCVFLQPGFLRSGTGAPLQGFRLLAVLYFCHDHVGNRLVTTRDLSWKN